MARQPPPPRDLDGFQPLLSTADTKRKLQIGNDLITYLGDPSNHIDCLDIGLFIDGLIPWMHSNNFKVCQNGLDAMTYLVDRMGGDFRPYLQTVLPPIIDRLGDSKDMVRSKAQLLLMKILERDVVSAQQLFDKLTPAFAHKNGRIREEVLTTLVTTINEHGIQSLLVSRLIPAIVKSLSDPMATVRDAAFNALVDIYRHVGERLRQDLNKKHPVPPSKLPALMSRFDEVREEGGLLPSALSGDAMRDEDEVDRAVKMSAKKVTGAPPIAVKRNLLTAAKPAPASVPGIPLSSTSLKRVSSLKRTPSAAGQAGAMDEEQFMRLFEDCPQVQLFSARELEDHLNQIRETIADQTKDWSKRVDALKKIRSLLVAGAANFEELYVHLRLLEHPFQASIKDLRSLVVREACISVAYLSHQLKQKMDHFAEQVLPNLIHLIQNSAKVVASAGVVTIRFILQYTHAPRLVPIIVSNISNKSRDIRRACCEFLDQLLHTWSRYSLEKHIPLLQEAIKKGISDADAEARLTSRKAYWGFKDHFPEQADALLNTLDSSYKRALFGELSLSNSSSNSSLHHQASLPPSRYGQISTPTSRSRPIGSAQGSTENLYQQHSQTLYRHSSIRGHRSGIPVPKPQSAGPKSIDADGLRRGMVSPSPSSMMRSNSAIDAAAAQRAKVRAQYAALSRQKVGSGTSLHDEDARARKSPMVTSPERTSRTRTRVAGVSQSQPTSRSGSPSSRLSYVTYGYNRGEGDATDGSPSYLGTLGRPRRLASGIPRSTQGSRDASRETSPNRFGALGGHLYDRSFGSKLRGRHGMSPSDRPPISTGRPVMAQKILQQSREAESALADALSIESPEYTRGSPRKSYRSFDDHSDESETSSVCSERSFESFRRPSDSYSWSGSQQRLYRDVWEPSPKDIAAIIDNCASTLWSDRKEGLLGLQAYFQAGNILSASELRCVTDIFTKMFMDSHTKVFSLFLDTLHELIVSHHADLNDWLYVLLTRLLNKSGADLLVSQQTKINKVVEVVRDMFPLELQLSALMRFLTDPAQTPNLKVKVATLRYLTQLAAMMDPGGLAAAASNPSPGGGSDQFANALAKIISWTQTELSMLGGKGGDIRKAAQQALITLFNLNTPLVTMKLASLPKDYQEAAHSLVQSDLRRSSSGGGSDGQSHSNGVSSTLSSPPSSAVSTPPQLQSPRTPTPTGARSSPLRTLNLHYGGHHASNIPQHHLHHLDDENLNPEEVHRSLRRTTAEIQSYSFEPLNSGKILDRERDRDTTSQDSGISQMSVGPGDKMEALEERMEDLNLSTNSGRASSLPSPTHKYNGLLDKNISVDSNDSENGFISKGEDAYQEDKEAIQKIVQTLRAEEEAPDAPASERVDALKRLESLVKDGSTQAIMDNFKSLLRVLMHQIFKPERNVRCLVLSVLTEMVKKPSLVPCFSMFVELLVLKVLQSHGDVKEVSRDEVLRASETCASAMAEHLPSDVIVHVLIPLIVTGEFPVNQSSIKMLTKLVDHHGATSIEPRLSDLMPGIMKAYENEVSSVRKAAVFCMVALHVALGEDVLAPYLEKLTGPKLKLLDLYIKRAAQKGCTGASLPTSPKNVPM
ncbi:CLIP-associating protein 1-A isoform X3 [Thrips palmi]|uniref:CLIP-associating protein 1-A isoform X3 n=1 Tax=Thrips palmi TaxID=161013 RepID=A0A6P9AND1_THRPL|nr:CLIP-associating protein 1-A isoform X3 [Thrips palmi]